jgi:hypothetical protein
MEPQIGFDGTGARIGVLLGIIPSLKVSWVQLLDKSSTTVIFFSYICPVPQRQEDMIVEQPALTKSAGESMSAANIN